MSAIPIRLNRRAYPIAALGPGRRAGIWMQGCGIGCAGCMAAHTWSRTGGEELTVDSVVAWVASLPTSGLDGITISGGEPSEQPEALAALLSRLRRVLAASEVDILVFTGREPTWAQDHLDTLFHGADAVMSGPYVADQAGSLPLRGSDNQSLHVLTTLGRRRYQEQPLPGRDRLEFAAEDDQLHVIGIPLPGALADLAAQAEAAGLTLKGTSWPT